MSAIRPRRVEDGQLPVDSASQPMESPGSAAAASSSAPTETEVALEAAAIYPDTNRGRPTPEEIAAEAYAIYMGRGAGDGQDLDDWLEAERRLSRSHA